MQKVLFWRQMIKPQKVQKKNNFGTKWVSKPKKKQYLWRRCQGTKLFVKFSLVV